MPRQRADGLNCAGVIPHGGGLLLWGILCLLAPQALLAAEPTWPNSSWRAYATGRITNEDYQMQAPPRRPGDSDEKLDANMFTGLFFFTDYDSEIRRQKVTLKLTAIRFVGYVDRSRSWRRRDLDTALLDHEQGHFDINEIYVRRASALIHDQLRKPSGVQVVARTRKQAEKALNDKIGELIEPIVYDLRQAHANYDRQTIHGTIKDQQELARKAQLGELKSSKPSPRRSQDAALKLRSGS